MTDQIADTTPRQYVVFTLRGDTYALDVAHVREIVQYSSVTRVPQAEACVRGVMNLRGTVLPVVDPALRYGWLPAEPSRYTCVLVLELPYADGGALTMGVVVDAVQHVAEFDPGDIVSVPAFGTRVPLEGVLAMARVAEGFVPVLDPAFLVNGMDAVARAQDSAASTGGAAT